MTTVLDLITDALQDAGILADSEVPDASMGQKAFRLLNRMLDADSTEDLMIYNIVDEVFPLIDGLQTYTMGPGGNWNTSRPIDITDVYMRDTNGNDLPVYMLNAEEYSQILSKPITATIALSCWYNSSYPLSEITFWPVPRATSYRAVIWSWKQLTNFSGITDTVSMPPGYEQYIETNLAVRLSIAFNRPLQPELVEWAREAKAVIKRINVDAPILSLPSELNDNLSYTTFPISPHMLTGY